MPDTTARLSIPPPGQPIVQGRGGASLDQRRPVTMPQLASAVDPSWYRFFEDLARRVTALEEGG